MHTQPQYQCLRDFQMVLKFNMVTARRFLGAPAFAAGAVVFLLWVSSGALAMEKTSVQDFILRNWDVDDGMPSTHVNAVARTPDGFVWLGTARGLTRFDGVHFTTFDVNYGATVNEDVITCLLVDRDGDLWVGTAAGRLLKLEKDGLEIVGPLAKTVAGKSLQSLAQDADGMIWIATDGDGLIRFDHQGIKIQAFTTRDGLPSNRISKIVADSQGKLWAIADGGWSASTEGVGFRLRVHRTARASCKRSRPVKTKDSGPRRFRRMPPGRAGWLFSSSKTGAGRVNCRVCRGRKVFRIWDNRAAGRSGRAALVRVGWLRRDVPGTGRGLATIGGGIAHFAA